MDQPQEALVHIQPAIVSAREQRLIHEEALLLLLLARAGAGESETLEEADRLLQRLGIQSYDQRLPSPTL